MLGFILFHRTRNIELIIRFKNLVNVQLLIGWHYFLK